MVFIVDDDMGMRDSLRWLLESEGLAVQTFETAEAFLNLHHPGAPGCLLLDVRLPGMSGLELQRELAARKDTLPVILMTAYAGTTTAAQAVHAGAAALLEKPLDDQLLLTCIRQALAIS